MMEEARASAEHPAGSWSLKAMTQNPLALEALKRALKDQGWSDASAQRVHSLIDAEVGQEVQHGSKRVIRDRNALTVTSLKETSQAEAHIDLEQAGQGHLTTPAGTCTWTISRCPETTSELHTQRAWIPAHCLPATLAGLEPWGQDSTAWDGGTHEGERRVDPSQGPKCLTGACVGVGTSERRMFALGRRTQIGRTSPNQRDDLRRSARG